LGGAPFAEGLTAFGDSASAAFIAALSLGNARRAALAIATSQGKPRIG